MKSLYESFWENGLQPELVYFLDGLNWTYIIMLVVILYGIKHTRELDWYEKLCSKFKAGRFKTWIAAVITGLLFCLFRWHGPDTFNSEYISALLRSMFFAVVFSGIFVDIPVLVIKRLGKMIDVKDDEKKED